MPRSNQTKQLLAQSLDNGADEQGAEQALGHGPQGVDAVTLGGDDNVLPLHEFSYASHNILSQTKCGIHVSRHVYTTLYRIFPICQP